METDSSAWKLAPAQWRQLIDSPRQRASRLSPALEAAFRAVLRRRYRYSRSLLLAVHALMFAVSPLLNAPLFEVSAAATPFVQLLELGLILPLLLIAIGLTLAKVPALLQQSVQTLAVIALGIATLTLRQLSLRGEMHFPSQMLGIVLVAVALFGGFSFRRIALGAAVFIALAITQEYRWPLPGASPALEAYTLALLGLIAILGAYAIEVINRINWLGYQYASSLAKTDALTGLSNRHDFNRLFPRLLQQAAREQRGLAVMLVDIDHFKSINDRYGHPFGDEVLRQVGRALSGRVARRPMDLVARYGGEELVVVWYDLHAEALPELAEGVLEVIRGISLSLPMSQEPLRLTASGGCRWLLPSREQSAERLLREVDGLLYQAKAAGRDRWLAPPPSTR